MQITGTHKSYIVARIVPLLLMLVFIFCADVITAHGQAPINSVSISVYPDGACEVPANDSAYIGTGGISYNPPGPNLPATNMPVTFRVTLPTNFPAIDAGIYGPAMPFQKAPLLIDLGQPVLITEVLALVQWSGTTYFTNVILGCVTNLSLTPQQFNDLNAGLLYVNVTSPAYPGGEIRGQFSNQPIVSPPAFQNGTGVVLNVTGTPLENYEVQVSTDLLNWTTFTNVYPTNTVFQVIDTEATNSSQRFYRVTIPGTGIGFL